MQLLRGCCNRNIIMKWSNCCRWKTALSLIDWIFVHSINTTNFTCEEITDGKLALGNWGWCCKCCFFTFTCKSQANYENLYELSIDLCPSKKCPGHWKIWHHVALPVITFTNCNILYFSLVNTDLDKGGLEDTNKNKKNATSNFLVYSKLYNNHFLIPQSIQANQSSISPTWSINSPKYHDVIS